MRKVLMILIAVLFLVVLLLLSKQLYDAWFLSQFPTSIDDVEVQDISESSLQLYFENRKEHCPENNRFCIQGIVPGLSDNQDLRSMLNSLPDQRKVNYREIDSNVEQQAITYEWQDYLNEEWGTDTIVVTQEGTVVYYSVRMDPGDNHTFTIADFEQLFGESKLDRFVPPVKSFGASRITVSFPEATSTVHLNVSGLLSNDVVDDYCFSLARKTIPVYRFSVGSIEAGDSLENLPAHENSFEDISREVGCD